MTFLNYLKAGYPCLWIQTHEEDRAIAALSQEAEGYKAFSWDIINGLRNHETSQITQMGDPLKPLQSIPTLPESSCLFIKDAHKFIESLEYFRTVKNIIPLLKGSGKHLVFVSPVLKIPIELEKDITIYEFNLPTIGELMEVANKIITDNELKFEVDEKAVNSAIGLTLGEAENSFALSVIEKQKYDKEIIEKEKLQAVKKSGLMEIYPAVKESELGGLEALKQYLHNRSRGFSEDLPKPKGILLVGLPGAGKSLTAKVTASVLDFPLIRFDIASLKGSLVGESEKKMRQATTLIDAISPCVLWVDEIEKALSGVQSSGKTDAGTTSAMFGHLLTWMQESPKPKYIIATCNDIDDLLSISQGALLRRFDDVWFVDLPSDTERKSILAIMNRRYKTKIPDSMTSKMDSWTGAEIEKFTVASIYDGVDEALRNVKPIFHQNREKIEKAREWARFNARMANSNEQTVKKERRVKV